MTLSLSVMTVLLIREAEHFELCGPGTDPCFGSLPLQCHHQCLQEHQTHQDLQIHSVILQANSSCRNVLMCNKTKAYPETVQ